MTCENATRGRTPLLGKQKLETNHASESPRIEAFSVATDTPNVTVIANQGASEGHESLSSENEPGVIEASRKLEVIAKPLKDLVLANSEAFQERTAELEHSSNGVNHNSHCDTTRHEDGKDVSSMTDDQGKENKEGCDNTENESFILKNHGAVMDGSDISDDLHSSLKNTGGSDKVAADYLKADSVEDRSSPDTCLVKRTRNEANPNQGEIALATTNRFSYRNGLGENDATVICNEEDMDNKEDVAQFETQCSLAVRSDESIEFESKVTDSASGVVKDIELLELSGSDLAEEELVDGIEGGEGGGGGGEAGGGGGATGDHESSSKGPKDILFFMRDRKSQTELTQVRNKQEL